MKWFWLFLLVMVIWLGCTGVFYYIFGLVSILLGGPRVDYATSACAAMVVMLVVSFYKYLPEAR